MPHSSINYSVRAVIHPEHIEDSSLPHSCVTLYVLLSIQHTLKIPKNTVFSIMTQPESSAVCINIRTEILSSPINTEDLTDLVQLINHVYDVADGGMWTQKGIRINLKELRDLMEQKRLIVAIQVSNGQIIGCVKVDRAQELEIGQLGLLVVDPHIRGQGVGRLLVAAAEDWAIQQGYNEMQLEILAPRTWKQPSKELNREWYTRLGYILERTEPFEKDYAHMTPLLTTACDFTIWKKRLTACVV